MRFPIADYFEGCPVCLTAGWPASVVPEYDGGMFGSEQWETWLAYSGGSMLGEGETPLVRLPKIEARIGVGRLFAKCEGANPTGSHKDRMSAFVVHRAQEVGASTVAVASSGNAGVSLAAYAASADLNCVIVTTPEMNANWRRAAEMHGAEIVATATSKERWQLVAEKVRSGAWYPVTNYLTPPVGSNPFGVDAYRAIAYEIFAQSGVNQPTDIAVPTSRGDIVWGVAQGYADLRKAGLIAVVPRVHAVEPFPRITRVLAGADRRETFAGNSGLVSIGGGTVTFQAMEALRTTGGAAVSIDETQARADQIELARAGLYVELSSASALSGLKKLVREGVVSREANAVIVTTSHGYKEEVHYDRPLDAASLRLM
ncbi:pyridoxal-phosphate dependent enzyme [Paraburkholderia sp. BL9I2N2]|uniref:pyridoxal-phosphate dependent enzyme n=1 Tax=Paraburkholderia sp. BL9I2N2 TaxID=1938809 RepID=UPI0010E4C3A3|nr:pyridoxal-phosphate dependent enzyme [Paraburkholderia sp. BL9I2N2]TCK94651.1 threonine synthase [Paraburkholderia sp. BL9I2N2]